MYRFGQAFGALLIAAGFLAFAFGPGHNLGDLILVPAGCFLAFRIRLAVKQSYRRDFKNEADIEVVVSESGIKFLSARGASDFNWTAFTRYRETKDLFMLYTQSNIFNIIPKRAFEPQQLIALRDVLERELGIKSAAANKKLSPQTIVFLVVVTVCLVVLASVVVFTH